MVLFHCHRCALHFFSCLFPHTYKGNALHRPVQLAHTQNNDNLGVVGIVDNHESLRHADMQASCVHLLLFIEQDLIWISKQDGVVQPSVAYT